jgi:hypothetical protein
MVSGLGVDRRIIPVKPIEQVIKESQALETIICVIQVQGSLKDVSSD